MVTSHRPKESLQLTLRLRLPLSLRLLLSLRPRLILAQRSTLKLRLTQSLRLKLRLVSRLTLRLELMPRQVGVIHAGTERWQLSRDTVLLRLALELLTQEEPLFVADKRARTAPVQQELLIFAELELQELLEHDRFVREE